MKMTHEADVRKVDKGGNLWPPHAIEPELQQAAKPETLAPKQRLEYPGKSGFAMRGDYPSVANLRKTRAKCHKA